LPKRAEIDEDVDSLYRTILNAIELALPDFPK